MTTVKHEIEDLDGRNFARAFLTEEGEVTLTLSAPSGFTAEGMYFPPESFTIPDAGVRALATFLTQFLEEGV